MKQKMKIAIFASGSGSNFAAIEEACKKGELNAEIVLMVTNKPEAFVVERAEKASIPVAAILPKEFATKDAYEEAILHALRESGAEWLVLAGYMRLVGPVLLTAFPSHIVNIHPSLLPSFPGKDAVGQAVSHGVKVTGVTVHLVDEGMDTGQILAQCAVDVVDGDEDKTAEAIHAVEHGLYKDTLNKLFSQ
ncbi:phosphoribosylglycinamide formyltransferase [Sporosarcina sp. ANT_H38]|uniref:phosphoribosylglycinamide formyltransferase n=1 Tax=Sporosarcina sp. ANT_H38 TaxID=2597358 RepID=UPI0011F3F8A3|nr:phosphoribosylglycinamide formyltransferase [Sporosarcina sp. ANT_H38]KAA0942063.1 phosphoribosylglycinamide formyltransferase [Sporosarcina sp. ANT_H38]